MVLPALVGIMCASGVVAMFAASSSVVKTLGGILSATALIIFLISGGGIASLFITIPWYVWAFGLLFVVFIIAGGKK